MEKEFFVKIKYFLVFLAVFCISNFSVSLFSEEYLLNEKAQKAGMTLYWDTFSSSGIIEKNGHQISFQAENPLCILDSSALIITDAPVLKDGKLYVTEEFISSADEYFKSTSSADGFKIGAILIDPGHGGKDPGASGTFKVNGKTIKVQEKDVVLSIGKMLYSKLKAAYPEKQIIMTRYGDTFPQLSERTDIANSVNFSPIYFHNMFTSYVGKTPHAFLLEKRLESAKLYLLTTNMPMNDIVEKCGFSSHSYFDSLFKKAFGITPTEFRNQKYSL